MNLLLILLLCAVYVLFVATSASAPAAVRHCTSATTAVLIVTYGQTYFVILTNERNFILHIHPLAVRVQSILCRLGLPMREACGRQPAAAAATWYDDMFDALHVLGTLALCNAMQSSRLLKCVWSVFIRVFLTS